MSDLRIGDNDDQKIWGGIAQPNAPPGTFIADLQRQLQSLGFRVARTTGEDADAPGVFGYWTSMAVREFQAYARLPGVAVDGNPSNDPFAYTGHTKTANEIYGATLPISGVVNTETARLLALWSGNHWRCPVILCGFSKTPDIKNRAFADPANARKLAMVLNAWSRHDHVNSAKVYCSIDYGDMVGSQPAVEIVGRAHAKSSTGSSGIGGLVIDGQLFDPVAKIKPASLIGPAPYTDPAKATFRVIISVAHFEASERFDAINGWDPQILSFGPYQFVMTALGKKEAATGGKRLPTTGELPAFFAMLQAGTAAQQTAFAQSFGMLGLASDKTWANIEPNKSQRTLVARLALQGPNGTAPMVNENDFNPWPEVAAAKEPIREWHLFRRAVVASRRSPSMQLAFWRFCRLRIRNLLNTPWGEMKEFNWTATTTLGDVFRSELATAVFLRLHVKSPGIFATADSHGVVNVRDWLKQVIRDWDYPDKTKPPPQWQLPAATGEQPLITAVIDRLAQGPVLPKQGQAKIFVPSLPTTTLSECRAIVAGKVQTPFQALQRGRSFTIDPTGL